VPIEFTVLGIDAGRVSGWAVTHAGEHVVESGVARDLAGRIAAIGATRKVIAQYRAPLVVVAETWSAGGWRSHKALIGIGKAWGRWLETLERDLGVREQHIVLAHERRWRHHLFDAAELKGKGSDELKRLSCTYAGVADHNQAEAICLAIFGQTSEQGLDAAEAAARRLLRAIRVT
jgi:hypothetical protein